MSKKIANTLTVAIASTYAGIALNDALTAAVRMDKAWAAKRAAGKTESEQKGTLCGYLYGMLQSFSNKAERLAAVEAFANAADSTEGVSKDWRSGSALASRLADCRTIATHGSKETFTLPTFQKALQHAKARKAGADDAEASRVIEKAHKEDEAGTLSLALPAMLKAFADMRAKVPACMLPDFDLGVMEMLGTAQV